MNLLFASAAACAYLLAAAGAWRSPGQSGEAGQPGLSAYWAAAGLVLHAAVLLREVLQMGNLTIGVTEAFSVFAWQAALLLWLFCRFQPLHILGLVLYPLAAAAALWAAAWPTSVTAIPLSEWKLQLHVVLSLFSAGFLTLAAVQSATLAIQDRMLHHPSPNRPTPNRVAQALPPLQTMERVLFQLITLGFFMLSLALVTGLLFVDNLLAQHLAHKTVLSITAWAIFGGLLWGRWRSGWRGRTAIRWSLTGYAVLILAYFGSKLVLEQILNKSWS
jgi:ABC-type uncharacterized transport system permease subunit